MKQIFSLIVTVGLLMGTTNFHAQEPDTNTVKFLIKASIGNLHEINAGQIAAQKAVDPAVKAFGKQMVTDHSKAQEQLLILAKAKGINLPQEATAAVASDPMLKDASPQDFDRIYVHMTVPGHRQTVVAFQEYALVGKNPDVKVFAQQTLPVIKEHLKMITELDDKLKNPAAK